MATSSVNASWMDLGSIPDPSMKTLPYLLTTFMFILVFYSLQGTKSNVPLYNPKKLFEIAETRPKMEFMRNGKTILDSWFKKNPNKPIRLISEFGVMTVLPRNLATEIRNDERLNFSAWTAKAFHSHIPGFESFREGGRDSRVVQMVIQKDLTKYLNRVTEPLSDETHLALGDLFTDNKEWHTIPLKDTILRLVARISSRVFLGEDLCRDDAWLEVTRRYTIASFTAANDLRLWPVPLRPIVHWFLPSCQEARALIKVARDVINPILQKRRQEKLARQKAGQEPIAYNDAIEWFEVESKGTEYDPPIAQLVMSVAAIHTTTDLLCQVVSDVAKHPEIIEPLRKEIITTLTEGGWKKSSLYNMKLLDSVIKESQRMKPNALVSMRRVAEDDIKLSDGTIIPKGDTLSVSTFGMWDEEVHNDPAVWDGYRWYNMRMQPGKENVSQLVATNPNHLAFGHGQHSCPGRFFAANEVKIAMVHLLLKYDWKFPEGQVPTPIAWGSSLSTDPNVKVDIRRRQEDIDLSF